MRNKTTSRRPASVLGFLVSIVRYGAEVCRGRVCVLWILCESWVYCEDASRGRTADMEPSSSSPSPASPASPESPESPESPAVTR